MEHTYGVGSVVEYTVDGHNYRAVVIKRGDKDGVPGFVGLVLDEDTGYTLSLVTGELVKGWGYDNQIRKVVAR